MPSALVIGYNLYAPQISPVSGKPTTITPEIDVVSLNGHIERMLLPKDAYDIQVSEDGRECLCGVGPRPDGALMRSEIASGAPPKRVADDAFTYGWSDRGEPVALLGHVVYGPAGPRNSSGETTGISVSIGGAAPTSATIEGTVTGQLRFLAADATHAYFLGNHGTRFGPGYQTVWRYDLADKALRLLKTFMARPGFFDPGTRVGTVTADAFSLYQGSLSSPSVLREGLPVLRSRLSTSGSELYLKPQAIDIYRLPDMTLARSVPATPQVAHAYPPILDAVYAHYVEKLPWAHHYEPFEADPATDRVTMLKVGAGANPEPLGYAGDTRLVTFATKDRQGYTLFLTRFDDPAHKIVQLARLPLPPDPRLATEPVLLGVQYAR